MSFSHLGLGSGIFFLIAEFPDHCLLISFQMSRTTSKLCSSFCLTRFAISGFTVTGGGSKALYRAVLLEDGLILP